MPDDERESWTARLARATNFVDVDDAERHLDAAGGAGAGEGGRRAAGARRRRDHGRGVAEPSEDDGTAGRASRCVRTSRDDHPFVYRVQVTESPVPTYGGRMVGDRDQYARLDVHLDDGAQGYDVMGYRESQVIHDCLDQYERHLEFLRLGSAPRSET